MSKRSSTNVNTKHKDRLFNFIFGREENKEWTLSLYNAVNGSDYKDASQIRFNTIRDVLYMGMRNDTSFLISGQINLYEHQSTFNPNMPLRMLDYLTRLYAGYIKKAGKSRYAGTQIKLPVPKLVVFYNGKKDFEDETVWRLSDAFDPERKGESDVEISVRMLNVNYGRNKELMEKCKPLEEYAWFIREIENGKRDEKTFDQAVNSALTKMPDDFAIKEFLLINKTEVTNVMEEEYNHEEEIELLKNTYKEYYLEVGEEEGLRKGRAEGLQDGLKKGENLLAALICKLTPGTEDYDIAINGNSEDRQKLYTKYNVI